MLDFALFVQSKWTETDTLSADADQTETDQTEEEILADEAHWDAQFMASREKLRKLGRTARDHFYAGNTTELSVMNDELAPHKPDQ
ncbi:MAG TPA: hypothetical protein PKE45_24805 [Caldilineaceae bacterium]|nr:hypothetical protein [Caldilineaceae bacterium]